jgi:type IV secretion system protein VirB11
LIPPVVSAAVFNLRFPPKRIYTMDNLLADGTITAEQNIQIENAVESKRNIIVAGGTGSGKTTIANAILKLIKADRIIVIEDTLELQQLTSPDVSFVKIGGSYTIQKAIEDTMRRSPVRVVLGEIRNGYTALGGCDLWVTGHPGGIGTIHSKSAKGVKDRLYSLMQQVVITPSRALIDEAVEMVIFCEKIAYSENKFKRKVTNIICNH